jgi:hypothetical protein
LSNERNIISGDCQQTRSTVLYQDMAGLSSFEFLPNSAGSADSQIPKGGSLFGAANTTSIRKGQQMAYTVLHQSIAGSTA